MRRPTGLPAYWTLPLAAVAVALTAGCPEPSCEELLTCDNSGGSAGSETGAASSSATGGTGGATASSSTGAGGSLLGDGEPCGLAAQCTSDECVDGVCCASACSSECESCNVRGSEGSCTADAVDTDPGADCGLAACDGNGACAYGKHRWSRAFTGTLDDNVHAVAVDSGGNVIISGTFAGTLDIGNTMLTSMGASDVFIAKLDASGSPIWAKRFGDAEKQEASSLVVDGTDILLGATTCGALSFGGPTVTGACASAPVLVGPHPVVVKLDANGNHLLTIDVGFGQGDVAGIATDGADNIIVAGSHGPIAFENAYIHKYSPSGAVLWQHDIAGTGNTRASGLAAAGDGSVWIIGDFQNQANFPAGMITAAGREVFAQKLTSSGAHLALAHFGNGSLDNNASRIAIASDGGAVVVGNSNAAINFGAGELANNGGFDMFVLRLSTTAAHVWSRSFGGAGDEVGSGVAIDVQGSVVLTGSTGGGLDFGGGQLNGAGGQDVFLASLDANGEHRWSRLTGSVGDQWISGLALASDHDLVVAGSFAGNVDFGGGSLNALVPNDIFVARLGP